MSQLKDLLKQQLGWFSAVNNSIQSEENSMGRKAPNPEPPLKPKKEVHMKQVRTHIELLGMKAKDKVTGFKGTVSCVTFDLYGCIQACLSPKMGKDGKVENGKWVDVSRLVVKPDAVPVMMPDYDLGYGEDKVEKTEHISEGRKGPAEKPTAKF